MTFLNDKRNLGGLDNIKSQLINHKATLLKVKSAIKIIPPKDHVDKYKEKKPSSKNFLTQQSYAMVRATYHTIYNMKKGMTDSNQPYTYGFLNNIKNRYKNRSSYYISDEHLKNVESLIKRQQLIGNKNDRKKNPYDPYVYPALFFRNKKDQIKYVPVSFNKTQNIKFDSNTKQIEAAKNSSIQVKGKNIQIYAPELRPTTARIYNENLKKESQFHEIYKNKVDKSEADPSKLLYQKYYNKLSGKEDIYEDIKKETINIIVDNRLYKNDELEKVFSQMLSKYSHLDITRLLLIKEEILTDLSS